MKCYAIKSGNEYIKDVPRPISNSYYHGAEIEVVDADDEAKHYKNKSAPKAWIKKNLANMVDYIAIAKKNIAETKSNQHHSYYVKSYKDALDKCNRIKKWIENAVVVELDLEKPNFPCDLKLRFNRWYGNKGSNMKLNKETHSRYCCKSCGVILKNIPYYELPEGNSTKICVACLYLRQEAIKIAFEGLPEDFRTQFTNELILGSM